jgi:hypothetical protein
VSRIRLIVIFLSFISVILSCATIEINTASRNIVYPGISSGKTYVDYEVVFKSNDRFAIKTVLVDDQPINNYSIQNLDSQIYIDIKKNDFEAGVYRLGFRLFDINKVVENNKVALEIIQKGEIKIISSLIVDKKPIYKK